MPGMENGRANKIVRWGLVVLAGSSLLGVYTQTPLVSLALQAAVFALGVFYLAAGRQPAGEAWGGARPLGWAALALAALLVLSTLFSVDRASSLIALGQWLSYGLAGWLAASVFRPRHVRLLVQCLLLLGVLMAVLAVYFYWGETGREALPVMNSIFGNKNHFGGYLLLLLPVALALYLEAGTRRDRLAYGLVSVFLSATFVLTYSRGAWFSFVPALALVVWGLRVWNRQLATRLAVLGGAVLVLALLISRGGPSLTGAVDLGYRGALSVAQAAAGGEAEGTLAPRLDYWQGAVRIMLDHPVLGAGLDTFAEVFPSYERDPRFYSRFAHDFFLQMGAEAGIPGLLASLALFALLAWRWLAVYRRADDSSGLPPAVAAGLVAGLTASVLHNLVELDWHIPAIGLLFALETGLLLGGGSEAGQPEPSPGDRGSGGLGWPRPVMISICSFLVVLAAWQWTEQLLLTKAAGEGEAAPAALETAGRLNPLDGEPAFRLAELHLANSESSGSREELDRALEAAQESVARSPARDAYRVLLARLHLQAGDLGAAAPQLEGLVARLPALHVPDAYRRLGETYLRTGRTEDARQVYLRLLAAFPQGVDTPQPPQPAALTRDQARELLAESHLALGNIYSQERELPRAEQEYLDSLALKSDSAPASFNLAILYYSYERFTEALPQFDRAAALDPRHAPTFYYRGLTRLRLGQSDAAGADFREALAVDPGYEDARRALEGL